MGLSCFFSWLSVFAVCMSVEKWVTCDVDCVGIFDVFAEAHRRMVVVVVVDVVVLAPTHDPTQDHHHVSCLLFYIVL